MTFLGEWGDRSQIATIAMAAGSDYWWVTGGALGGHAICTGVAVIGGKAIAGKVSLRTDPRFGYNYTVPKHKQHNLLHSSTQKKFYHLQAIKPTGPNSLRLEVLRHTLGVVANRSQCGHGGHLHKLSWKVDFGHGSHLNRTCRVGHDHRGHPHWATIEATLEALNSTKEICAVNRMIKEIVIVVQSELLVRILVWGESARKELSAERCPDSMQREYRKLESLIKYHETHGRTVKFWFKKD
ncbi:MAG: hypothetical protein Q9198_008487 [Flavoplaca austrocitrina]